MTSQTATVDGDFTTLLSRQIVLVTGKGGVGKTSVSAALAMKAVKMGKRPLIITCDGRPSVGRILGSRDEGKDATPMKDGISALTIDFHASLADLIGQMLGGRRLVEAFLGNRVVKTFVDAAPSVLEMTLLHRIDRARTDEPGGPYSPIIVDLPASGHALALLSTPRALMRMIRMGPLYRRAVELLRLVANAKITALCAVTLAEELPINETIELVNRARALGVTVGHVVVNAIPATLLQDDHVDQLNRLKDHSEEPLKHWAQEALQGNARSRRARAEINRLVDVAKGPVLEVPFVTHSGAQLAETICNAIRDAA